MPELTAEDKRLKNIELQGKKAYTTKKVRNLNDKEALAEKNRLANAGHQDSKYYQTIVRHLEAKERVI